MTALNYQNEVDDILNAQEDTYQPYQDPTWRINTLELAVWADEKIHEKEIKIEEIEKIANGNIESLKAKIEKLEKWKEDATKKDKDDISFFKEHLHLYHKSVMDQEKLENEELKAKGKKEKKLSKTIKLPYRDLTSTVQAPTILINGKEPAKAKDDKEFVEYVKGSNPSYIKTTEEVKWSEFKDTLTAKKLNGKLIYVDEDGAPLDFIQLTERGEKYDWKLKKD